jgi:hypothetical protein
MPARVVAYVLAEVSDRSTAGDIAAGLRVSPAAISGAVRYLVQAGLLGKEREPGVAATSTESTKTSCGRASSCNAPTCSAATRRPPPKAWRCSGYTTRVSSECERASTSSRSNSELDGLLERWRAHRTRLGTYPPDEEANAGQ